MTIYKYPIAAADSQVVEMPIGSQIIAVQMQHGTPCLWAIVNETNTTLEKKTIEVFGTGHPMNSDSRIYIGTVQMNGGALVFHVFERL